MTYQETIEFLFGQLPMYQRVGAAAYKADLSNTTKICGRINNPQNKLRFVHVAGTNGKGSVAHFIASILQEAGYATGLYTSPHLSDFRERIRVNGNMIPEEDVVGFVGRNQGLLSDIKPSFFEYTFAIALDHFREKGADIVVLETGMGGRLDSTNVVIPEVSVITNIGLDHTQFLGNTIGSIAMEKAGIIKEGIPVVICETRETTQNIFTDVARAKNSEILFADQRYITGNTESISGSQPMLKIPVSDLKCEDTTILLSGLPGTYQALNIPGVLQVIDILNGKGYRINDHHILNGTRDVITNTGIRGRWELLSENPGVICDIGHNMDGIREVIANLEKMDYNRLHFVYGTVNDKEVDKILKILPPDAEYYFCKPDIPRGYDLSLLAKDAEKAGLSGETFTSVRGAVLMAEQNAADNDLIFIGGSTFVVAEVLQGQFFN